MKIRILLLAISILAVSACSKSHEPPQTYKLDTKTVQEVFNKLAKSTGAPDIIEPLQILDSDEVNAWTDGKNITITTGLMKHIENNDELALVLAHEMGHVLNGDVTRGDQPMDPRVIEANADKMGAFIMMRAGFDVCKGKQIFKVFEEIYGDSAIPSDHPDDAFRLDQLNLPQCSYAWAL